MFVTIVTTDIANVIVIIIVYDFRKRTTTDIISVSVSRLRFVCIVNILYLEFYIF